MLLFFGVLSSGRVDAVFVIFYQRHGWRGELRAGLRFLPSSGSTFLVLLFPLLFFLGLSRPMYNMLML